MQEFKIKDLMVKDVVSIHVNAHFHEVEKKLREHHIRHLPVVDDYRKVVGIITQRDLYHTIAPRRTEDGDYYDSNELDEYILKRVMTPTPVTVHPEDSVVEVIHLMADHKYGCIPVVTGDRTLAGIVTQVDVMKFISRYFRSLK